MKWSLYFHNDFDGYASAAIFSKFLKNRGEGVGGFYPVDHDIKPRWAKLKFNNPTAIFDFYYHPKATFWVDHHLTTFIKESWKKDFKKTKHLNFNPKYNSCCHLTLDILEENFGFRPPAHFRELVRWLDVIDMAKYKSAKQVIDFKDVAIQIGDFIDQARGKRPIIWMIDLLREKSLRQVAANPRVKKGINILKKRREKDLAYFQKHLQIFDEVSFMDISEVRVPHIDVAPFYLCPDLKHSVTLSREDGLFKISLRTNPWKIKGVRIHLGGVARRYGGGGHKGAAGMEIKTKKKALGVSFKIIKELNNSYGRK